METITLNNGVKMPVAGFGVFQIQDQAQCEQCVVDAVHAGYRLIDTAAVYGNEAAVGRAVQRCGVLREELFLTSKLWVQDAGYEAAKKAIDTSLKNLQTDYLDLYLIHRPFGDYYGAWRAMKEAVDAGKLRAIGLSNFDAARVMDLTLNNRITPAVDQVECHPFYQQEDTRRFLQEQGIVMEAWAPFAEGKKQIFQNEILRSIGAKYGKSPAQVILRWNIQRGIVPLAKSVHLERMEQNLDVFDFTLSDDDTADYANFSGTEYLFGGTSIKREAGKELSIDCTLEITEGTAKVFWISGSDEAVTLIEATGTYSDTITLPDGGNYIGIECENFTGNIELNIE